MALMLQSIEVNLKSFPATVSSRTNRTLNIPDVSSNTFHNSETQLLTKHQTNSPNIDNIKMLLNKHQQDVNNFYIL